jgi:hypothetical protein
MLDRGVEENSPRSRKTARIAAALASAFANSEVYELLEVEAIYKYTISGWRTGALAATAD